MDKGCNRFGYGGFLAREVSLAAQGVAMLLDLPGGWKSAFAAVAPKC